MRYGHTVRGWIPTARTCASDTVYEIGGTHYPRGHGRQPCSCTPWACTLSQESSPLVRPTVVFYTCLAAVLTSFVVCFSPVAQLGRISTNASSASRAAKKRVEMITAFDELSSHLHTTFSALSTALARNQKHGKTDSVYLALVLGPTIGAPKARVVLVLEGLEVKVWGEGIEKAQLPFVDPHEGEGDSDDCNGDGDSDSGGDSDEDEGSDIVDDDADANASEEHPSSPPASELPSSRSPSPLSDVLSPPSASAPASTTSRPLRLSLSPKSPASCSASQPYLAPKPARTHAEEQRTLRAAERLLARTLVNANAESGGGMAVELGAAFPP